MEERLLDPPSLCRPASGQINGQCHNDISVRVLLLRLFSFPSNLVS